MLVRIVGQTVVDRHPVILRKILRFVGEEHDLPDRVCSREGEEELLRVHLLEAEEWTSWDDGSEHLRSTHHRCVVM